MTGWGLGGAFHVQVIFLFRVLVACVCSCENSLTVHLIF